MTCMVPSKRAAASILSMRSAARQFCLPAGGEHLDSNDGATSVLDVLKSSIYQGVVCFLQYRRTAQTIDGQIAGFLLPRRLCFPKPLLPSCTCRRRRFLAKKFLVLASTQKSPMRPDVAATMRRLFRYCGGAVCQDLMTTEDAAGPLGSDKGQEVRATYKKERKQGAGQKGKEGLSNAIKGDAKGGGQTSNAFNHRTGLRNRSHKCDSGYHLAPTCSWRDAPESEVGSATPERGRARKPSYSAISAETPVSVREADQFESQDANSAHERPFATTLDVGGLSLVAKSDSAVFLDTGATANLACSRWLEHHGRILPRKGYQRATTFLASARYRFGDGRHVGVRHAADILVNIAGSGGKFNATAPGAAISALLRRGAL